MKAILASALALSIWSIAPAYADFDPQGGSGDRQDADRCPADSYLAGVKFRSGKFMDQIQVMCAHVDKNGNTGTPFSLDSSRGGYGGGPGEVACGTNQIVGGIYFTMTPKNQVQHVKFYCTNAAMTETSEMDIGGVDVGSHILQSCGPAGNGQAANGITINSGKHVNALGLMCGPLPVAATASAQKKVYRNQPGSNDVCRSYGDEMEAMVDEAKSLDCAFLKTGGGWGNNASGYWERSCMNDVHMADDKPWGNRVVLRKQLDECKKSASVVTPRPSKKTVTAINATNVYPANDGQSAEICAMSEGDTGQFLGTKPGEENWVHVSGISGDCGGKSGWVWNGGDLKIGQ